MKLFVTPPIAHLDLSLLGDKNFYILAQLYKKYPEYRIWVREVKKEGKYLILDNGAGDEGEVIEKEELFEIAGEIQPHEVIPTDVLFNQQETIDNLFWFIKEKKKKSYMENIKIFAVPQGNTFEEYMNCYNTMIHMKDVSVIGLSKKTVPHVMIPDVEKDQGIEFSRNKLFNILRSAQQLKKEIHCLGMGDPREYLMYSRCKLMRSTDSCYPILAAMNGIYLGDLTSGMRVPTPADYFERTLTADQIKLAKENVNFVKICCSSVCG